jgi:hypothetical protein
MARAKKRAGLSYCMNNMRQITMAVLQYADDNQGKMPRVCILNSAGKEQWGSWNSANKATNAAFQDLRRYVKSEKMFQEKEYKAYNQEITYRFNEAMNYTLDPVTKAVIYGPRSLGECSRPRLFYIIADRRSTIHMVDEDAPKEQWQMPMAFADGHIRGDVRIYSREWMDAVGQYKPYHWNFPNCCVNDIYVTREYN